MQIVNACGFTQAGWTTLRRPLSLHVYEQWLQDGHHGNMDYLNRHLPDKADAKKMWPRAQSAIVVAVSYLPHPEPMDGIPLNAAKIALYAQGKDYHLWLKLRLEKLCQSLRAAYSEHEFVPMTDSAPVMERDLAYRAGLGWIGKNTCLIHPQHGSLFFIGEIYTSLATPDDPMSLPDHCGTCRRCLDACPTQALVEPRKLVAEKCISYLTIEATEAPAEGLRNKMGNWFFGCDICQTVCPWNLKRQGDQLNEKTVARESLVADLRWILTSSNKALEKTLRDTALSRAGGKGLKRNALIVIANQGLTELQREVQSLAAHPILGELAQWTIQKLADSSSSAST